MCDYSLHHVQSRPAKVGDKLVSSCFKHTSTRGFVAVGEPTVANELFDEIEAQRTDHDDDQYVDQEQQH